MTVWGVGYRFDPGHDRCATWLSLGLVAAIVAPAAAGLGAWVAAGDWQTGRETARGRRRPTLLSGAGSRGRA